MQRVPTTLTPTEIEQFERDGFVVVKGAFAREDAEAMQDAWWRELFELYGIKRDDRSTWHQPVRDLRGGKKSPMQTKINTARLHGAIDDLLGAGSWHWPKHWGRAVMTFPSAEVWDVPGHKDKIGASIWHWDSPVEWHHHGLNGVFAFAFVGEVVPGGGGTSIIAGSYRLLQLWDEKMRSLRSTDASAHRDWFQRAHPWLAALSGHVPGPSDRRTAFMEEGAEIEGVRVRVVEMSGAPGDMYLCHPTIVHCVSPNCARWPRMMRIGGVQTDRLRAKLGRRVE